MHGYNKLANSDGVPAMHVFISAAQVLQRHNSACAKRVACRYNAARPVVDAVAA